MTPMGPETKTKVPHSIAPRLTQKSPGQRTDLDTTSSSIQTEKRDSKT